MSRASVLLVDGDPDTRNIYTLFLQHVGFTVLDAGDGPSALEAVRTHRPAAIVTELWLKGIDGLELIRKIRSEESLAHACVIVLTSRHMPDDRVAALNAGCTEFLTKPVEPKKLAAALATLLDQ
jgi:DNA-binding response OmpR family regulator